MIGAEDLELLKPELVFVDIDAEDTEDLFRQMQVRLDSMGYIKDNWLDAMLERERNYATGLQTPTIGVAIPHADNCVNKAYIAVIKPVKPVTFQPMGGIGDEVEAELVINLGIMREGGQVEMLQALMRIFMDDAAVVDIMAQNTPEDLVATIKAHLA
ncbi:PTS sugar transporter subunit IIA [Enorma burkinafasonensis]|uniref:PTS sugar transporter subunit IIA n=1 Tax=Enorma burkinafasonensis TaxID=2590867 RepID=UPI0011A5D628|nr:PTS sugar transporter subunit IIA [Enorma burkinafasonensis]